MDRWSHWKCRRGIRLGDEYLFATSSHLQPYRRLVGTGVARRHLIPNQIPPRFFPIVERWTDKRIGRSAAEEFVPATNTSSLPHLHGQDPAAISLPGIDRLAWPGQQAID